MEDYEMIEAMLNKSEQKRRKALEELQFAIKFAESNGKITTGILKQIEKQLK